jgi:hypothetical protein
MYSREGWSHPAGSGRVGWAKHYRNSPIVYLQGGDDAVALGDPNYRALVHNAIRWVASAEARAWARARNGAQASPVLEVCGLHLRVHGYRFPDAHDAWDGNWLDATVECHAHGAVVTLRGALVRTGDLLVWARACEALRSGGAARAELAPLEPALRVVVEPLDSLGHLSLQVELSPDYPEQRHRFVFGISQDMLPRIAAACDAILACFPPRGEA